MNKTHLGHTARKRFGQNFLNDTFVIEQIVDAINPQDGENLVEIGLVWAPSPTRCVSGLMHLRSSNSTGTWPNACVITRSMAAN